MKRFRVFTIALVALLAVCAFAAVSATAKKKTVATSVTVVFTGASQNNYGEYGQGAFSGQVTAKKGCQRNRNVSVQKVGGSVAGTTVSTDTGAYTLSPTSPVTSGQYSVTVEQSQIKKKKKSGKKVKFKCQPATETISVP